MLQVKDPYYLNLLNVNGYFTIPFLSLETVSKINTVYHKYFNDKQTSFYSTSFHPDMELKLKVNKEVTELVLEALEQHLSDYKLLGTSFLKKNPNDNNPLPLHQDWTVTDEEKYGSYTIWVPLQDTDEKNGALRVIPGSHKVENCLRAPSIPVAFDTERPLFEQHLKTIPLKAGEAFVFNHKVMHASWPNYADKERLAITIGLVPKDAELFMLYFDKQKQLIHQYSMPDELFLHYPEIIEKPNIGKLLKSFSYSPPIFKEETFKQRLFENRIQYTTMQALFANPEHQAAFEKNGFLKINALDETDVNALKDFLYQSGIKKETEYGFYVGMDHENKALVAKMMEYVASIAMPKIAPYLKDYQLITASYVIKDPNPKGVVPPHQDWTFVEDELQHCSVTCWIALVDTNMENGCMGVIKGSHKFLNNVRPSPSPQVPSPLAKHMFSMFPYFELLPMKAGEALIFDNRTFHASPPNITNEPRLAVGLSFTQKDAVLRHYYFKPGTNDTLLKYKIDPAFFTRYDNATLSKMYDKGDLIEGYDLLGEEKYVWEELTKDAMKERILSAGNVYNKELMQHMLSLFGEQMKSGIAKKTKEFIAGLSLNNFIKKVKEKIS